MYDYSDFARAEGSDCWTDAAHAMKHARRVLLFGPPGTGKTRNPFEYARSVSPKAESITLDSDTTRGSLVEMPLPGGPNGAWVTVVGPALRAFEGGYPLVVNELDRIGEGNGETVMHAILDDAAIAQWTLFSGRVVRAGDGFACYATMNGTPDMLPSALRDRFDAVVFVDKPHPGILAALRSPMLRRTADAVFADDCGQWVVTPRQILRMDDMIARGLPFDDAVRIVVPESALRERFVIMAATHTE